jgi:hypothetical protein
MGHHLHHIPLHRAAAGESSFCCIITGLDDMSGDGEVREITHAQEKSN